MLGVERRQAAKNGQRRIHRPPRMVRHGHRGTPERHDAVADVLVHRPVVGLDHLGQVAEHFAQQRLQRLRLHAFRQAGEAAQVAEHDRQLLGAGGHAVALGLPQHLLHQFGRHVGGELPCQGTLGPAFDKVAQGHVEHQHGEHQRQRRGQRHRQSAKPVEGAVQAQQGRQQAQAKRQRTADRQPRQAQRQRGAQQQQQADLIADGVVRPHGDAPVQHAGDQVGVDLDPGVDLGHGRGAQIHQAGGGKAQQSPASLELGRGQPPFQHIERRNVAKRPSLGAAMAAVGHQGGAASVHRDAPLARTVAHPQRLQRRAGGGAQWLGPQRRTAQAQPQGGQGQGFVERAVKPGQHRHGAHGAIRVGHRIEKPGGLRSPGQCRHIATVPIPVQQARGQGIGLRPGRGQRTGAAGVAVAAEVVTQGHRRLAQGVRQQAVTVERRRGARQPVGEGAVVPQFPARQLLQAEQAGAAVRLGEDDVQAQRGHLLALGQLPHQGGDLGTAPRPLALARQAGLVDVDDHHALVERARHAQAQAQVVQGLVPPVQKRQAPHARGVQHRQQHQGRADQHPRAVPLEPWPGHG